MPPAFNDDVSEQYLELVREHFHRFRDALAVNFPEEAPHLALVEMPEIGCVPIPRRRVTDLLEFAEVDREPDQLELRWRSLQPPEPPPPPPSAELPEPTLARARPAAPKKAPLKADLFEISCLG